MPCGWLQVPPMTMPRWCPCAGRAYQAQALEQIPEDQREDKTRRLLSNIAALARVWGLVGKMDDLAQAGKGEKEHEQR